MRERIALGAVRRGADSKVAASDWRFFISVPRAGGVFARAVEKHFGASEARFEVAPGAPPPPPPRPGPLAAPDRIAARAFVRAARAFDFRCARARRVGVARARAFPGGEREIAPGANDSPERDCPRRAATFFFAVSSLAALTMAGSAEGSFEATLSVANRGLGKDPNRPELDLTTIPVRVTSLVRGAARARRPRATTRRARRATRRRRATTIRLRARRMTRTPRPTRTDGPPR